MRIYLKEKISAKEYHTVLQFRRNARAWRPADGSSQQQHKIKTQKQGWKVHNARTQERIPEIMGVNNEYNF